MKIVYGVWGDRVIDNRHLPMDKIPDEPVFDGLDISKKGKKTLAFVAWNGFLIFDESVDLIDLMRKYVEIIQKDVSCGKCTPCRLGTKVAMDVLMRIVEGVGRENDLKILERMAELTYDGSMCELGHTSLIPLGKALIHFRDIFLASLKTKNQIDTLDYRWKVTAPCIEACPIQIDIPQYIEYIKRGYYSLSLLTIQEKNPLSSICGRICVAFCEHACRRKQIDSPIAIKHLKRFVSDWVYELEKKDPYKDLSKEPPKGKKVAIVGAGPAGLTAAHFLLKKGYDVHIFEATDRIGGMMMWGIPEFRLPEEVIKRDVRLIEDLGAEIHYNKVLGRDITIKGLKEQYDALFISIGAKRTRRLNIPGEEDNPKGYYEALEFLKRYNNDEPLYLGKRAIVVGAGNVAMDCCRSLKKLGVDEVLVVYRRTENEMPAHREEYEAAIREGVKFQFLVNPTRIIVKDGKIVGVELVKMKLGEPDSSGRRRPEVVEGSEFVVDTDMLIPAIGQQIDLSWLDNEKELNIKKTKWNTISVDKDTLMTDEKGVFAGGDCVLGPATLIEAAAQGERAATYIDQYLRDGKFKIEDSQIISDMLKDTGLFKEAQFVDYFESEINKKMLIEETPLIIKKKSDPENIIITPMDAITDADRCLRCYKVILVGFDKGGNGND
ncbi:FAD-dependent oxidoreductase [Desulfothermus okinawensis JCM 13304]